MNSWLPHPPSRWREFLTLATFVFALALVGIAFGLVIEVAAFSTLGFGFSFVTGYLWFADRYGGRHKANNDVRLWRRPWALIAVCSPALAVLNVVLILLKLPKMYLIVSLICSVIVGAIFGIAHRHMLTATGRVSRIKALRLKGDQLDR